MEYQSNCSHPDIGGECPFCETSICCKCAGKHFAAVCHVNRHFKLHNGRYCPSCKIKEINSENPLEHIGECQYEVKKWRQYFLIARDFPELKGGTRVS